MAGCQLPRDHQRHRDTPEQAPDGHMDFVMGAAKYSFWTRTVCWPHRPLASGEVGFLDPDTSSGAGQNFEIALNNVRHWLFAAPEQFPTN
jgi:hypothetical protein